jgi:cGMP-dependent protein kinase
MKSALRTSRSRTQKFVCSSPDAETISRLRAEHQPKTMVPLLNDQMRNLVKAAMHEYILAAWLPEADVMAIIEEMEYFEFEPGDEVEGQDHFFFVVQFGSVEAHVHDEVKGVVSRGGAFGRLDVGTLGHRFFGSLPQCPPDLSVYVREAAGIWAISSETIQRTLRERSLACAAESRRCFKSVTFFEGLPARQVYLLSDAFIEEVVEAGVEVVTKGAPAAAMYFVRAGSLRVVDPEGRSSGCSSFEQLARFGASIATEFALELARLGPGDCFGERALLYNEPRTATVIAAERCELLRIDAEKLRDVLGTDFAAYLERCLALTALRRSNSFCQLTRSQQSAIVRVMQMKDCKPGELFTEVNDNTFRALFVIHGEMLGHSQAADSHSSEAIALTVQRGQSFEASNLCSAATTSGSGPVACAGTASVSRLVAGPSGAKIGILWEDDLAKALGTGCVYEGAEDNAAEHAHKMLIISKIPIFRHISQEQKERVVRSLLKERYARGTRIIQQGEPGTSFFLIAQGQVAVTIDGKSIRTQGRNACFGERALLFHERRTASIEVSSDEAELWTIDQETFGQIVTGKMREDIMYRIRIQDVKVNLKDLRPVKLVGTGAFSTVRLVEHKQTGVRYALKCVKKEENGRIPISMRTECSILAENDHPFVLYVVKTFETPNRVCMLTELITGGDLHAAIRKIPTTLSRRQAQFYVGSLLIALEALWDRNIVYRDLKPENVMLDAQGYIKIIDFGISKMLGEGPDSLTFTTVGTPHYMAPEVMCGRGYGLEVDVWSLGIMLFEFICGELPFADHSDDPNEVCKAVLREKLVFPARCRDSEGHALMTGLLTRDPRRRLGAGAGGLAEVRSHRYFSARGEAPELLFDKILGRELDPPYLPKGEIYCDEEDSFSDEEELWPPSMVAAASSSVFSSSKPSGSSRRVTDANSSSSSSSPKSKKAGRGCMPALPNLQSFSKGLPGLPSLSQKSRAARGNQP